MVAGQLPGDRPFRRRSLLHLSRTSSGVLDIPERMCAPAVVPGCVSGTTVTEFDAPSLPSMGHGPERGGHRDDGSITRSLLSHASLQTNRLGCALSIARGPP